MDACRRTEIVPWSGSGVALRFCDELPDLARLCVAAKPRLLKDGDSIKRHFEAASARRNQVYHRVWIALPELSRQTGGSGLVVSNAAVFDLDVHGSPSLHKWFTQSASTEIHAINAPCLQSTGDWRTTSMTPPQRQEIDLRPYSQGVDPETRIHDRRADNRAGAYRIALGNRSFESCFIHRCD